MSYPGLKWLRDEPCGLPAHAAKCLFGLRVAAENDTHQGPRPAHAHAVIHAFITAPYA